MIDMIRRLIYWFCLLSFVWVPCPIPGDSHQEGLGPDSSASAKKDGFLVSTIRFSEYG